MYLYRTVISVPFDATSAFEDWWQAGQAVLQACPGNVGAGAGIGLWTSLAQPSLFLTLVGWDDYAVAAAAVRGTVGAWLREHPLPAGATVVRPGEAWETLTTNLAAGAPDLERQQYLRQIEYQLRPNVAERFERDVAEAFQLVAEEMPEVRASVLYRSAGIPGRYRVVFRMLEAKPLPARVASWVALHPYTDYTDERWTNELYVRTR